MSVVPAPTMFLRPPARRRDRSPTAAIALRLGLALLLVLVSWGIVLIERSGYTDTADGHISVVDALYYTTVTLTTTGYGDITPVTTAARLVNALVVTPMRLLFVVLLVGTTLKALTRQSRDEFRLARWRRRMREHVVVLGFGTKGRNAARAIRLQGVSPEQIVIVEQNLDIVEAAAAAGHTVVHGRATDEAALGRALVDRARTVIVAVGRDDTAVLATLTVARMAPGVDIVATAREGQNAKLLEQSGAKSVIVSSETAGRLLGLATFSPQTVDVVEDLLSFGEGLDLVQRPVTAAEIGRDPVELPIPVLAVLRGGAVLHYNNPDAAPLLAGDQLVYAHA